MRVLSKKKLKEVYLSQLAIQIVAFNAYAKAEITDEEYRYLIDSSLHTVAVAGGLKMVEELRKDVNNRLTGGQNEEEF